MHQMQKNSYTRNIVRLWLLIAVLIAITDEIIKFYLVSEYPDFVHRNTGVLFNFPLHSPYLEGITIILGITIAVFAYKNIKQNAQFSLCAMIILCGGAGNLIDRLILRFTVDYLYLFGRLAFNLCDVLILLGILGFLFSKYPHKVLDESKKIS